MAQSKKRSIPLLFKIAQQNAGLRTMSPPKTALHPSALWAQQLGTKGLQSK